MSTAIRQATKIQIGKELTRGTAVAATRRILTEGATFRNLESLKTFENQIQGTLAMSATPPVVTRNHTEFELTMPLDFEQVLLALLSGMKGGVTPTTPGTGEGRLWTFTPAVASDPLPDTYTIEFSEADMDASPNALGLEAPYGFATSIQITGSEDSLPELSIGMVARQTSLAVATAAISLPTVSYSPNARWGIYIDSAWAGLGGTQITGQIMGFQWTFDGFLRPVYRLDNRSALDFARYEFKPRNVDLTLDTMLDAASGGLVPTEDSLKTAGTKRFVRVELTGDAFVAPDTGLNRFVRLDGCYVHAEDSMQERGGENEGNVTNRLHLTGFYDSTQAQDVEVVVQNNLASFP